MQGQGSAVVNGGTEKVLDTGIRGRSAPELVIRRDRGIPVEELLGGGPTPVLVPQPLGVGGEALVQPEVLPLPHRETVAEPLVGALVRDNARVLAAGERVRRVDRTGLRLQRGAEAVVAVHD